MGVSRQTCFISIILITSLLLCSCATGPHDSGEPQTALDRSISQCIVSVGAGAILGALLGGIANRRGGAGTGAAIGAGAGAVACIVILAINNKEDRERVRQARLTALQSGADETTRYVGDDGNGRIIHTSVQTVPTIYVGENAVPGKKIVGPCRRAQTQITVQNKGTATLDPELVCQTSLGDWVSVGNQGNV